MRIEFRSNTRGYTLALERDLFGAFILIRRWYGLGNRRGGVKREVFLQEDAALRELKRSSDCAPGTAIADWRSNAPSWRPTVRYLQIANDAPSCQCTVSAPNETARGGCRAGVHRL